MRGRGIRRQQKAFKKALDNFVRAIEKYRTALQATKSQEWLEELRETPFGLSVLEQCLQEDELVLLEMNEALQPAVDCLLSTSTQESP